MSADPPVSRLAARVLCGEALRAIVTERVAQIDVHGRTPERDVTFHAVRLPLMALSYLDVVLEQCRTGEGTARVAGVPATWPVGMDGWNPGDLRANLVKVAALTWAAIDRLDAAPPSAADTADAIEGRMIDWVEDAIGHPTSTQSRGRAPDAATCPTCANRMKQRGMDDGGGDFWRCTAVPRVPAFTGQWVRGGEQQLVNLRSFSEDHPCYEYQRAKSCSLYTPTAEAPDPQS